MSDTPSSPAGGSGGSRPSSNRRRRRRRSGAPKSSGTTSSSSAAAAPKSTATTASSPGRSSSGGRRQSSKGRGNQNNRARGAPAAASAPAPARLSAPAPVAAPLVAPAALHANRRRARLLATVAVLGPAVLVGVLVGVAAGLLVGVVAGVALAIVLGVVLRQASRSLVVRLTGARGPRLGEEARLVNLMEGLCATFGLRVPTLLLVDDPVPNSCSVGRDGHGARVLVTTGLLERLDLIEMEGIVAHELAHVKRGDAHVSSLAVAVAAPFSWLTGHDRLLHRLVGRGREFHADRVAVGAVRYPPGLHDALVAMEGAAAPAPGSVFTGRRLAATRWLWADPMVGRRDEPTLDELDATALRVAALEL